MVNESVSKIELLGFTFLSLGFIIPVFVNGQTGTEYAQTAAPFLSTAAFLLLFSANRMQKNELKLQREELALQRKELTETREVFKEQEYTMKLQRTENSFFTINKYRIDIIESISYFENFKGHFAMGVISESVKNDPDDYENFKHIYDRYVKCLYSMIYLIDNSELKSKDRDQLFETLRLQMTSDEYEFIDDFIQNNESEIEINEKLKKYFN
ncbi:hypothetical protein [Evansella clarkii]|uniref:hypothetical protein n=1 Tax=Evansella clarkii TaxID=79879 RepID=UPI000995F5C3|nr:hypothetical protein [Evansella clarkii]